jgi:hypothetical protein
MDVARTIENAAMTASPWEYHAALLPLCFEDSVVAGSITTTAKPGRPTLMEFADEAEQRRFLKALLRLPWLAPEVRWAVMKSLGLPARGAPPRAGRRRRSDRRKITVAREPAPPSAVSSSWMSRRKAARPANHKVRKPRASVSSAKSRRDASSCVYSRAY